MLVVKILHVGDVLCVSVAEILQVVCVLGLEFTFVLNVLHVRYVLVSKMLQVVSICLHMGVVTPAILYLPAQAQHWSKHKIAKILRFLTSLT